MGCSTSVPFTHPPTLTAEKQSSRLDQLERIVGFSGRFYSDYWIKKNVLKQTDDEIEEIEQQNKQQPDFDAGENY